MRAVALVADGLRSFWYESELAALDMKLDIARSAGDAVAALVDDTAHRPQILFVDFDPLTAVDVMQLHAIRDRGWFGVIIAVGDVAADLRRSLNVERVLPANTTGAVLRETVTKLGLYRPTTRMPPLRRR